MKLRYPIIMLGAIAVTFFCCDKVEEGYLSEDFTYRPFPFVASQGIAVASPSIEMDGSSRPLTVKLLEIRRKSTGKALDSVDLQPRDVPIYLAELIATDTTMELVNKKIAIRKEVPISLNSLGGRIQLTAASEFLDTGRYQFDVEVNNVRGKKVFKNIGEIQLNPKTFFEFARRTLTSSPVGSETDFQNVQPDGQMPIQVVRNPDGPNKIVLKFVDKNGVAFNPKKGELVRRGDRPHFAEYAPFFPEMKTDTALEYEIPKVPKFPFFMVRNDVSSYYRVPGAYNSLGRNLNATFAVTVYGLGTWELIMMLDVTRTP